MHVTDNCSMQTVHTSTCTLCYGYFCCEAPPLKYSFQLKASLSSCYFAMSNCFIMANIEFHVLICIVFRHVSNNIFALISVIFKVTFRYARPGLFIPHVLSCSILQTFRRELLQGEDCRFLLHALIWCHCFDWDCSSWGNDTLFVRIICKNHIPQQFIDVHDGQ